VRNDHHQVADWLVRHGGAYGQELRNVLQTVM